MTPAAGIESRYPEEEEGFEISVPAGEEAGFGEDAGEEGLDAEGEAAGFEEDEGEEAALPGLLYSTLLEALSSQSSLSMSFGTLMTSPALI